MVKAVPVVVLLFKFITFTTQWTYGVQKSSEDVYDIERLLNELSKTTGQGGILHIKSKYDVGENKYMTGDEENQNINVDTLNFLNKNDNGEIASMVNNKHCKAGRCGCGRGGLRCRGNRDDNDVNIVYNDGVQQLLNELEREIEKYEPNENKNKLRCNSIHGRCGRGRTRNGDNNNNDIIKRDTLIDELENHGKKFKVNDNVDAIVIDLDKLLDNLNRFCPDGECNNGRNDELIKLGLNDVDIFGKGVKTLQRGVDLKTINVTGQYTEDAFIKQVKNILMNNFEKEATLNPEDLFTYYQLYKNVIIDKIMDYVKSKDGRKRSIQNVTKQQKRLIDNVKHQSQNSDLTRNDKEIKKEIVRIIFGAHSLSKVVSHNENNNNIYIPEWFYKKVVQSKNDSNLRVQKRLLPLTLQQRQRRAKKALRLWRRYSGPKMENYGVPFEMQVQGLGQVIP